MRRWVVILLVGAFLAIAVEAGATIVPQQGMAGIRLGMTKAQVRARLGAPLAIVRASNFFGRYTEFRYPHLVTVTFQGNANVTNIRTTGRRERTIRGVGVGSTEAAVRRRVRGVRCETVSPSVRDCLVGRLLPGRRVTSFRIRAGRVVRVDVGFVID